MKTIRILTILFLIFLLSLSLLAVKIKPCSSALDPPFTLTNAPNYLITPTHDGSGQVVHPDILRFDVEGILPDNYTYIMVITPYGSNYGHPEDIEVPNILYSKDGLHWEAGPASNPIVPHLGVEPDPSIVFKDNEFYLFYAQYRITVHDEEDEPSFCSKSNIASYYVEVNEGRVYKSTNSYQYENISLNTSPWLSEVIYDPTDNKFKSWEIFINGTIFYHQSYDGLYWNTQIGTFDIPPNTGTLGHMEVERMSNGEYWCTFGARVTEHSDESRWFMKSRDGINWQGYYKHPVISPSSSGWDNDLIYKSHFIIENGTVHYWYSARNADWIWHLGYTNVTLEDKDIHTISNVITLEIVSNVNTIFTIILISPISIMVMMLILLIKKKKK